MYRMPGGTFTFIEYYKRKYDVTIEDPSQPLLRISNARARPDMRNPVFRHDETAPIGVRKDKDKNREEFLKGKTLLLPELVRIHPVPASLWRECQIFPFVVSRVQGSKCSFPRLVDSA